MVRLKNAISYASSYIKKHTLRTTQGSNSIWPNLDYTWSLFNLNLLMPAVLFLILGQMESLIWSKQKLLASTFSNFYIPAL